MTTPKAPPSPSECAVCGRPVGSPPSATRGECGGQKIVSLECYRIGWARQKATADRRGKLLEALAAAGPLEAFRPELAKRIRAELEGS